MVPQGEVPVASFHIRAGTLEHLRERFGRGLACVLLHRAQPPKGPIGLKQWGAEALSQRTQWRTFHHGASRGHALEVVRWNQMRMHREGLRWCQRQCCDLLAYVSRDELDRRLHFGHHALGFRDPLQAGLAESFLLSNGAKRGDVLLDIPCNELAVAPHAALPVHKMVGVADGAHALRDLLALPGEMRVLVVRCCHSLGRLLQAWSYLWRTAWTTLGRLTMSIVAALVHPLERLFSLRHGLGRSPLFDGQRRCDRFAQRMLHMEEIRRAMRPEVLFAVCQPALGRMPGRL